MKKLQVKTPEGWKWVFCRNTARADSCVTTPHKAQALPGSRLKAWADDDLAWARKVWGDRVFRLAESLEE